MKHFRMLGLIVMAAAVFMALVGVGTASATTLTGAGGAFLPAGTELHAVLDPEQDSTFTTAFKNITCEESTIGGKTTNETGVTVSVTVAVLSFGKCNCEVKTLKTGTLSISVIGGGPNGTVRSSGAEITVLCSTIFGNVHCIYATNNTDLGALTGSAVVGATATLDIADASIPVLATSAFCSEGMKWDAKYVFTTPDTLNVDP